MPQPNKAFAYRRKLTLVLEEVENSSYQADIKANELRLTGKYHMVRVTQFRIGSKRERIYHYAIRAYIKNNQ